MGTKYTWLFAGIGSMIFSYIPTLWGASYFSLWSLFFGAIGSILGIWIAFKVSND